MALSQDEIDAIQKQFHPDDPPKATPTPTSALEETKAVLGNGLKVALVAGSILGAGFLLWRWREGSRADEEAATLRALEAGEQLPGLGMGAPSAHCSCGGPPATPALINLEHYPDLRDQVLRRLRS